MKEFDEVFVDKTKYGTKLKTSDYKECGKYPIIDQGQETIAGYTDAEDGVFKEVPVIIFGDHTRVIKYVDKPFFLGADGVKVLRSKYLDANYRYLFYALLDLKIPNTGYNRHFKWLKEAKIQYPTLKQQEKVVGILDKIEKVIADYNSLSSYDKTKVSGFDDTERALAVVSEKTRNIIVFAVLTVVAVLLILFVVLRIRKRIKKKKEIDFEEE